jgi:endonuclease/exonuclease/phosphatase family metal-dependent hydrolase
LFAGSFSVTLLRVATYNIHKGVQGLGPAKRLEIHNLALAIESLKADVVCLQEVREFNHKEAQRFAEWPSQGQADFLAPPGYEVAYRTNAVTRHGEHGNALLSRWPIQSCEHRDISDHRLEQRGFLHVTLKIRGVEVHVLVVHLGLIRGSRIRQLNQLQEYIHSRINPGAALLVAGDFNDWGRVCDRILGQVGLRSCETVKATFPSRLPMVQLDHVYARGLLLQGITVPRGREWWRLSDHLPLIAEFSLPN